MTKKAYAEQCLERAENTPEGPWEWEYWFNMSEAEARAEGVEGYCELKSKKESLISSCDSCAIIQSGPIAEFIAQARTDVPELARRLILACHLLRFHGEDKEANELEAVPENKE